MAVSSPRERRILRKQQNKPAALNLVSLMDVFTILVFFLLVNTANVQSPSSDLLKLPEAKVDKAVKEALMIHVNNQKIVVQGRKVADVDAIMKDESDKIAPLFEELSYQASRSDLGNANGRDITVMADRKVPFALLKKIMLTAGAANYGQVSLVVISKPLKES